MATDQNDRGGTFMNTLNTIGCNPPLATFGASDSIKLAPNQIEGGRLTCTESEQRHPGNLPSVLTPTTSGNTCPLPSLMRDSGNLAVDKQANEITTAGGYKIQATGEDNQVAITTPEGKKVDISGDPHVKTSDGTEFQIMDDSTIQLKDGTVVALNNERTSNDPNSPTTVKDVSVFSANGQYSQITGIDQNKPQVTDSKDDGAVQTFGEVVETASPSFSESTGRTEGSKRSSGNQDSLPQSLDSVMGNLKSLLSSLTDKSNNDVGEINKFVFQPPCGKAHNCDERGNSGSDLLNSLLKMISQMLSLVSSLLEANNQSSLVRFNQLSV